MTKRKQSNARQSSLSIQTLDLQTNESSSLSMQTQDLQTSESSPSFEIHDSYFEDGLHGNGINVQLCSTTEDFHLFSILE